MNTPNNLDTFLAMDAIQSTIQWKTIRQWLQGELNAVKELINRTVEPMLLNRLIGEMVTISCLIEQIENSPSAVASFAETDSTVETDSIS